MTKPSALVDLAKTIRSKNAGVDCVTFDIFMRNAEDFGRVVASKALTPETFSALYGISENELVTFLELPALNAIKITIKRARPSGSPGETDTFGSQQYAPLLGIQIA